MKKIIIILMTLVLTFEFVGCDASTINDELKVDSIVKSDNKVNFDEPKETVFEVNENEWNNAFDASNYKNVCVTNEDGTYNKYEQKHIYKVDNNIIKQESSFEQYPIEEYDDEGLKYSSECYNYKDTNGVWWNYYLNDEDNKWYKQKANYQGEFDVFQDITVCKEYGKYTYNEEGKFYTIEEDECIVKVYIEDGKLLKILKEFVDGYNNIYFTDYGTVKLTLPENEGEDSHQELTKKRLSKEDLDKIFNKSNFKNVCIVYEEEENNKVQMRSYIKYDGDIVYVKQEDYHRDEVEIIETYFYYDGNQTWLYQFDSMANKWYKMVISENDVIDMYENLINEFDKEYDYIQTYECGDYELKVCNDVIHILIEDGKVCKIGVEGENWRSYYDFEDYGKIKLTLPEAILIQD